MAHFNQLFSTCSNNEWMEDKYAQ